ncbi:MAG: tRNA guanosine(34) transglycosylase Tgt [Desulfobacterales bacterium]|nr:tRNA guanosine(34) transglycosylase Tgt [Desulfobacterales bacterium]
MKDIGFRILAEASDSGARRGQFHTSHGAVETPAFSVVGTSGFVRSTTSRDVAETGTQILLANTYHMSTAERLATVKRAGGLHRFMAWDKTILTDSGGFQVFSLPGVRVTDEGAYFPFKENEKPIFLSPEKAMEIQRDLGADIVMAFDECVAFPSTEADVQKSVKRTTEWAHRCRNVSLQDHQFLFGIVQGGVFEELRRQSAREITAIAFDGFAIGGVSVGEGASLMIEAVRNTAPLLPWDKPRYVMGIGMPEDIIAAVEYGVDMFDCVIPTRFARNGILFSPMGKLRIMDKNYLKDRYPVDTHCQCYTCRNYSRMVLRYLFFSHNSIAETLATIHNITFYQSLMGKIRDAIERNQYGPFKKGWLDRYTRGKSKKK